MGDERWRAALISYPKEIEAELLKIKAGDRWSIPEFRIRIAQKHGARNTFSFTPNTFLRIVAMLNFEKQQNGDKKISPFQQVVFEKDTIVKKLSFLFPRFVG